MWILLNCVTVFRETARLSRFGDELRNSEMGHANQQMKLRVDFCLAFLKVCGKLSTQFWTFQCKTLFGQVYKKKH
jgi:hypothetical protein